MSGVLPSGSILPAGLLDLGRSSIAGFDKAYKNFDLKMGVIIAAYDKDDPKNLSKISTEYDVAAVEQNEDLGQTMSTYHNCVQKDIFGGIGDYFEFSYRVQTTTNNGNSESKDIALQNGSIVLLLCLNGSDDTAIILGGLTHPLRKTKLNKESGHSMYAEFNGLELSVDKNGALKFFFKGATDIEGNPLDKKVGGSIIEITKEGSVRFSDGNKEAIVIDKNNKKIIISAEKSIELVTDGEVKIDSKKKTTMNNSSFLMKSQGGVVFSGSSFSMDSEGVFNLKAASLSVNSSGDVNIKGQQIVLGDIVFVGGQGGGPAVTINTSYFGIGNLGAPTVSRAIGPFSSKVFIGN